ncbi:MAG TPA: metal-dependent hydrolase [Anaerolineae bacterium]|nr:metal-dependent hydrolase [Anaerolineae bacterium]
MTLTGHIGASVTAAYAVERLVFKSEVTPISLGLAALIGILPDLDTPLILALTRNWRLRARNTHHQFFTHTPFFYFLITLLLRLFMSTHAVVLFGLLTILHLALDSWATDDGIMWKWPKAGDRTQYSLFPRVVHTDDVRGWEYYVRYYFRTWHTALPELLLMCGGLLIMIQTLGSVSG